MKYEKTLAVLAGLTFAGSLSQAQIAVGENLTISGFVDASYSDIDDETAGATNKTAQALGVDQVEIDFDFSLEAVSASVQVQSTGGSLSLEQAYASLDVSGITLSGGKMLNLLGFEADEPTGMLQYSYAYSLGGHGGGYDPGSQYENGLRAATSQGDFSVAASVYAGLYASDASSSTDEVAYEIAVAYSGIENLSLSLGYAEDNNVTSGTTMANVFNVHAGYALGQINVAAEWNSFEDGAGNDGDGYLIVGTYAINDKTGLTVRYSEVDADGTGSDLEKFTVSPNYAVTDNLSAVLEYSTGEYAGNDVDVFAIEGLLTF
jgi:hypothetical protein